MNVYVAVCVQVLVAILLIAGILTSTVAFLVHQNAMP